MTEIIQSWKNCKHSNMLEEKLAGNEEEDIAYHTCNNQKMVELMEQLKTDYSKHHEIINYGTKKGIVLEVDKGIEPVGCTYCKFHEMGK